MTKWESKFFGPLSGTRCYCGELAVKTLADPAGTLGLCETHLRKQYLAESKGQVEKESKNALTKR